MAHVINNFFKLWLADQTVTVATDTLKVLLVDSTNDADANDEFLTSFGTFGELSGTGYTPGPGSSDRKTLASVTLTRDAINNRFEFDADDVNWPNINAGTAAAYIMYQHNSNVDDGQNRFLMKIDSGGFPFITNGGPLTIQFDAEGIFQIQ